MGSLSGTKSHSAIVLVADFVHGDERMGILNAPLALLVSLFAFRIRTSKTDDERGYILLDVVAPH